MERDKDYDNAFHYLEILLQVIGVLCSLRWCVAGAGVAGGRGSVLFRLSLGGAVGLVAASDGRRFRRVCVKSFLTSPPFRRSRQNYLELE